MMLKEIRNKEVHVTRIWSVKLATVISSFDVKSNTIIKKYFISHHLVSITVSHLIIHKG